MPAGVRVIPVATREKYLEASEDRPVERQSPLPQSQFATLAGFLYLAFTVICSSFYLVILQPHLKNDMWMPQFNSTGMQTFVGDIFLARDVLGGAGSTSVTSTSSTRFKDYSGAETLLTIPPSAHRRALLSDIPFEAAIENMRTVSLDTYLSYRNPLCWVDMDRTFDLAHSAARQARCQTKETTNAAFYLEPLLRNKLPATLINWPYFSLLNATVLTPMSEINPSKGSKWISNLLQRTSLLSTSDEASYWTSHGLQRFTLQLQNSFLQRIDGSIFIVDALGMEQKITINAISTLADKETVDTTFWASLSFSSDFNVAAMINCSVVRHAPNDADALGLSWDTDILYPGVQGNPGTDLMRSHVGPFGSLDIRSVQIPSQLADYFLSFRQTLYDYMQQHPTDVSLYASLLEPHVDPMPPTWTNKSYYGGNPMCPMGSSQDFIQPSFALDDNCMNQESYTIQLLRDNIFFALVTTGLTVPSDICNLCSSSSDACFSVLQSALPLVTAWNRATTFTQLHPPPLDVVSKLNISFMQFAIDFDGGQAMLLESLVSPTLPSSSLWSFYGWVGIHDWLVGTREVYAFEGDISTLTVLTEIQPELNLEANDLEIPRKACFYIWIIVVYITFVLVGIVSLMILYAFAIGFHVEWWNLFQCNWVIGYVWIGRPFLFLRGMTAMVLLSSSSLVFESHYGFAHLVAAPKSLISTMIVAGEATWLSVVLHDISLPFMDQELSVYAPISTAVIWAVLTIIQSVSPFEATVSLSRTCSYEFLGVQGTCSNGSIQFGSIKRLGLLCITHFVSIAVVYWLVKAFYIITGRRRSHGNTVAHVLIPGVAQAFFVQSGNGELYLDRVACIMCGMFSFRDTIFHVPSWIAVELKSDDGIGFLFDVARFVIKPVPEPTTAKAAKYKYIRIMGFYGFVHMALSVTGSYAYLGEVKEIMANDFWWQNFNTTAHQTYLCNWFNRQLLLQTNVDADIQLDTPQYAEIGTGNLYNSTTTKVYTPPLYASAIQLEANTLTNVITGLRQMSGCHVPWIATAYCYADFNRSWEMANTLARQQRCLAKEKQNGAVYLEAVLRNADWPSLLSCWNESLTIGVFSFMQTSNSGQQWLSSVQAGGTNSVGDEVALWQSHGITEYVTQWQNYKELGIFETFSIANAFGFSYPMTIKRSRGSMRTTEASSMKMYWSFASDLWAVSTNTTAIGGYHLIRQSPSFAFTNTSLADVMGQNGTLPWPLGRGLSLVEAELGPFGAIDVKRVACPSVLRQVYQNLTESLVVLVNVDSSSSSSYNWLLQKNTNHTQVVVDYMSLLQSNNAPFPLLAPAWDTTNVALCGGKLMCELASCGGRLAQDYFSVSESCGEPFVPDAESPTKENVLKAMLAVDLRGMQILDTLQFACSCAQTSVDSCAGCVEMLVNSTNFLNRSFTPAAIASFRTLAQTAESVVRDVLAIEMIQFTSDGLDGTIDDSTSVKLSRENMFVDPRMAFSSWLYLFDWVEDRREVVTFIGDNGNVTTMSDHSAVILTPANPRELPLSFSYYTYRLSQYITGVLFGVAIVVCLYIISNKGDIEQANMGAFNMVAGLVWVGRPMILLRALSAICVLATAKMDLVQTPVTTRMYSDTYPWFTTFLSTGEVSWLVFVIDDLVSVLTKEHLAECKIKNKVFKLLTTALFANSGLLSWITSGIWSAVSPVHHITHVGRTCTIAVVDMDVECTGGVFQYGLESRFVGLVLVTFASCTLAYIFKLIFFNRCKAHKISSFFLPAVAKYNFNFAKWEVNNTFYLDKSSAVLSGILIFEFHDTLYVFDAKIWRRYAIDVSASRQSMRGHDHYQHVYHALPLVE